MDWFTIQQHQELYGSKVWGHIDKAYKTMVRGTYQLSPYVMTSLNCFTQTFGGHHGLNSLKVYFLMLGHMKFTIRGSAKPSKAIIVLGWMTFLTRDFWCT